MYTTQNLNMIHDAIAEAEQELVGKPLDSAGFTTIAGVYEKKLEENNVHTEWIRDSMRSLVSTIPHLEATISQQKTEIYNLKHKLVRLRKLLEE